MLDTENNLQNRACKKKNLKRKSMSEDKYYLAANYLSKKFLDFYKLKDPKSETSVLKIVVSNHKEQKVIKIETKNCSYIQNKRKVKNHWFPGANTALPALKSIDDKDWIKRTSDYLSRDRIAVDIFGVKIDGKNDAAEDDDEHELGGEHGSGGETAGGAVDAGGGDG